MKNYDFYMQMFNILDTQKTLPSTITVDDLDDMLIKCKTIVEDKSLKQYERDNFSDLMIFFLNNQLYKL